MLKTQRQFTLLLVDDNPTNLLLLVKIIELDLPEVRVLTASSALEGLQLAEREQIHGAFIDVQMPQMDGLEMCRQLRTKARTAAIPLVLMTAHVASPKMRAAGLEVGAYDFISQPISNVEMLARIKVMLRLCENEQRSFKNNQQLKQQVTEHADRLRWISGLLISGDGSLAELDQQLLRHLSNELPDPAKIDDILFFEKLVTEFPLPWRRTLLRLSLLDSIPVSLAHKLSEITDVAAVFDYLSRHQISLIKTQDGENYLFLKPQIRAMLRQKAEQDLSARDCQQVVLIAADWFQQNNLFPAALDCLIAAGEYPEVSQLLSQLGLSLLDHNYRSRIFPLIERIPEPIAMECGWLSLFHGCNEIQRQSSGTVDWLALACHSFQKTSDRRGELLALAQQVSRSIFIDGFFATWGDRLAHFRALAEEQSPLLAPVERLKVAFALGLVELFFAENLVAVDLILKESLAEAQRLNLEEQQLELNLLRALYALQQGRYLVFRTALEQGLRLAVDWHDLPQRFWLEAVACIFLRDSGDLSGLRKQQQLLTGSSSNGLQRQPVIAILIDYYQVTLLLARGEIHTAAELLDVTLLAGETANSPCLRSCLLQLRGWIRALAGEKTAALADLKAGLESFSPAPVSLFSLENLLFAGCTCYALGDFKGALKYFSQGLAGSKKSQEERFRGGFHAWLAVAQQQLGKRVEAAKSATEFLDQLQRHRLNFFWGFSPELIKDLLPLIGQNDQERLLQPLLEGQLLSSLAGNNSQIPLLRITCLGKFQLALQWKTFDLSHIGQASRQIFALLVVAPNGSLSLELMMGMLWPDSPSRLARSSFDTTHARLRNGLEGCYGKQIRKDYLVLEKGMLSLRHVQIDSVVFAEAMAEARYHLQREHFWQAEHALWKMDELWDGEFLSGYDLDGELPQQREQLTQMRLEQLGLLARLLQRRQQRNAAAELLQSGLLLDPTQESMVRQLLSLYRQQQDSAAVNLLLENYRIALQHEEYEPDEIEELIEALNGC